MAVHKAGGGKRRTAGVADYFAVLGMHLAADDNDEDDPHPPSPSPSPSSPPMSGDNDPGRDAQKPAGDDVGDLDDDDGECAVPPSSSSAAAEPDGGVGDDGASSSSSSSPPSGTERNRHYSDMTPRNRRNLSRKVLPLRDDDDAAREDGGGGGGGGGGGRTSAEADGDRALRLLREERFRREIVGLALISSPLALPNDDDGGDGGDDESSRWTVAGEADLPVVFPRGRGDPMTAVRGGGGAMSGTTSGRVHLACRRRRCSPKPQPRRQRRDFDRDYHTPGVADVSIHYVKLRPSTIIVAPPDDDADDVSDGGDGPISSSRAARAGRNASLAKTTATAAHAGSNDGAASNASPPPPGGGGGGGGGAARHLSSLARHGVEMLTAAAINYAMMQKSQGGGGGGGGGGGSRDHFFPDNDDDDRRGGGAPQCRGGEQRGTGGLADGCSRRDRELDLVSSFRDDVARDDDDHDDDHDDDNDDDHDDEDGTELALWAMRDLLPLPNGYDEWVVPEFCETLRLPYYASPFPRNSDRRRHRKPPTLVDRTHVVPSSSHDGDRVTSPSSVGMEAMYLSPTMATGRGDLSRAFFSSDADRPPGTLDPDYMPILVPFKSIPKAVETIKTAAATNNDAFNKDDVKDGDGNHDAHMYIPVLAIRRQRVGEEECYHEDPSIVEVHLTYLDDDGLPPKTTVNDEDDDDGDDEFGRGGPSSITTRANVLKKSAWTPSSSSSEDVVDDSKSSIDLASQGGQRWQNLSRRRPVILLRRNIPNGFADVPIAPARVLDRFPRKNYRGMPFPEEELPLFCYPRGGVYLVRDKLRNLTLPKSFGFVVKNERGDSIYGE